MILLYLVKKRGLLKFIFLILAMFALIICGILREGEENPCQDVFSVPVSNKIIVLDAGHGGFDAGASANQAVEKDINLRVTMRLKEYLEQGGAVVLLTRDSDVSTADADKTGVSAKKSDLAARKEMADGSDCDIFVSIHMNQFPQEQYRGAQVFYCDDQADGKRLGEEIQQGLKDVVKDQNTRVAKKIDGGVFLLKNTTVPSVIVECGFLSNPQEAKLLQQDEYQQKIAWGIYLGIVRYFNQST